MKYNKQLFDHIEEGYNQAIYLGEFIFDNLIEKQEEIIRVFEKSNNVIDKRQQQLANLDKLVKSRFVELST